MIAIASRDRSPRTRRSDRTVLSRGLLVAATVGALALTACGSSGSGGSGTGGSSSGASGKTIGSLTLPNSAQAVYAPFLVGAKKGFFKQVGIDVNLQSYPSGIEQLDAVLTGQSDISGNGQYNIPPVAAKGGQVKIIGEYATSGKQFGVVANSSIKTPHDLIGKTVATQSPSSFDYYYDLFLKKYNLDRSKIKLKNIPFAQQIAALKNGDVDAYFSNEPFLTDGVQAVPGAHILKRSGDDNVFTLHVYLAASKKLYSNPALAKAFLRGMAATVKWMNAHIDTVANDYYNQMGAKTAADAKAQLQLLNFKVDFNNDAVQQLNDVNDYMTENKIVSSKPDLSSYLDQSFAKAVFGPTGG